MSKYVVLYRSEAALEGVSISEMFANTPPEQMEAGMAMWKAWYEKNGASIADFGAPLDKSTLIGGGGLTPQKSSITGYTVLEAESIDQAAEMLKDHPHFFAPGASVEILECVPMQ
jgi:hypothetical protein